MTSEHESNEARGDVLHSLTRSWFAVWCLFAFCILFACISAVAFLFQFAYTDEFGDLVREQPGGWAHLLGHLLRVAVGAGLAWCSWRYLQSAKRLMKSDQRELGQFFQALARWWNILAISVLLMVVYAALVAYSSVPGLPIRPLSQRFRAEPLDGAAVSVEFRLAEANPTEGLIEMPVGDTLQTIFLHREPLVTNRDITEARVVADEFDHPTVEVAFAKEAQPRMRAATERHRGKPLAILVDGKVIAAPIVRWQVGERATIQAGFSHQETERIARSLAGKR